MGRGPTALLEQHGLEERLSSAGFDVAVDTVEIPDALVPEIARTFELNRRLAHSVRTARAEGAFPIVLSGNCNCAWGATAGCVDDGAPAVLWLDAHADFDVPDDNLSGFLDVMALSTLTGACWQALAATIPGFKPRARAQRAARRRARSGRLPAGAPRAIGDLGLMGSR